MSIDNILLVIILIAVLSLLYALIQSITIIREEEGPDHMRAIANAIREGAKAFISREYRTAGIVAVILAIIIALALRSEGGPILAVGFIAGFLGSAVAGLIGMLVSIQANVRVANRARKSKDLISGLNYAFSLAFRGGSVTGFSVVGFALLLMSVFYYVLRNPVLMSGLMFGASLMSLFARVGGGIYTKGADVGADLVGKVGLGLPEDDPRNPAVIADNVGDNVGDTAGMAADLYETYVVTGISAMLLAYFLHLPEIYVILPLLIGALAIIAAFIALPFVRLGKSKYIMGALYKGLAATVIVAGVILGVLFYILKLPSGLLVSAILGYLLMALMVIVTEYYTSYKFGPTRTIAASSQSGAAITIINGLGYGLQASFIPAIGIIIAILLAYYASAGTLDLASGFSMGVFGIAIASAAMLSLAVMILSIDAFGPITDNAGGIAEMAQLPEDIRDEITDPLDAVGNTTKAVTKAYAIASAALASLVLFTAYLIAFESYIGDSTNLSTLLNEFLIYNPLVIVGLIIGAVLPFFFTSFLMRAVGKAADSIVQEVKRQVETIVGLLEGKAKPDYGRAVDIVTATALREFLVPGIIAIVTPLAVGFILGPIALAGVLFGVILSGFPLAIMMTTGGAAWDNAKKYIEQGNFGGKGSEAHKAAVVGDTVGDAVKDTAGPAINPLVKVVNTISILFLPAIISASLLMIH
ncbi:MAG: sodium-translocating pyrophosphatase [Sulfolobaceae archaeon]|nr:sodium-translocating pyrophosphatase [Sulfolobaceae archaeon]